MPKQKFNYSPDYNVFDLAASYSFDIANNHPFIDGNKRTAFTIGIIFIELNGYQFTTIETEATLIFKSLASETLSKQALSIMI